MSARLQKSFCAPCPFTEVCRRSDLPTFLFLKSFMKTNRTLRALSSHADLLLHNTAPKIRTQWYINFTFHLWRLLQLLIGTVDVKKNGSEFLCVCVFVCTRVDVLLCVCRAESEKENCIKYPIRFPSTGSVDHEQWPVLFVPAYLRLRSPVSQSKTQPVSILQEQSSSTETHYPQLSLIKDPRSTLCARWPELLRACMFLPLSSPLGISLSG